MLLCRYVASVNQALSRNASPPPVGEKRCVTTLITAAKETIVHATASYIYLGLVSCLLTSTVALAGMNRNFLIAAVLAPLVCFLLFKFQDGDFTLMIYEKIGQDPAVALHGKVVRITGASSGIGEYLAYELVKYGCKLVLSARRKAELERVKKNCAGAVK